MKRRFSSLLTIFLLGCCPSDDSVRSELAIEALSQARMHFDAAGKTMFKAIAIEPKAAARALATHAIESGGLEGNNLAEAYALRAAVNHSFGSDPLDVLLMQSVVLDLISAIDLDPENLGHYHRRAMAYEILDKFDLAIHDYTYILQVEPKSPVIQGSRGYLFFELGDYEAAIADFTAEIALDADEASYLEFRGDAYKAIEDFEKAIDDYLRAKAWHIEFRARVFGDDYEGGYDPSLIDIGTKIAVTYEKMGRLEQAVAQYEEILKHDPADSWAKARLEALSGELPP